MNNRPNAALLVAGLALLLAALTLVRCDGAMNHGWGGHGMMNGMMDGTMPRHRYVVTRGIDSRYVGARNPLTASAENLAAGKSLYAASCSACHGSSGHGDGPAAQALHPVPADLAAAVRLREAGDAYLYWTIAEGGAPVGSAMPAFKAAMSTEQIWQVVLYLRTL